MVRTNIVRCSDENFDEADYELRRRLPRKLPKLPNDIYVNNKTNFKAQLVRCENLLAGGHAHLFIHGLGAAAGRAINLALQLQNNHHGTLQLSFNTSSQRLVDDLICTKRSTVVPPSSPGSSGRQQEEEEEGAGDTQARDNYTRSRLVSAVHVHVVKMIRV